MVREQWIVKGTSTCTLGGDVDIAGDSDDVPAPSESSSPSCGVLPVFVLMSCIVSSRVSESSLNLLLRRVV